MPDSPETMLILGEIKGTLKAVVEDIAEIKKDQQATREVLTTLRIKTAGVAAVVSFIVVAAGTFLKGFFARGGQ